MENPKPKDRGKLWAILSYIFILWIIPWWIIEPRNDFAVYHAKQACMLFLAGIIVQLAGTIIPIIGWYLISPIGGFLMFILWIIGIFNAVTNNRKPLPVIGKYAEEWFKNY